MGREGHGGGGARGGGCKGKGGATPLCVDCSLSEN